MNNAMEDLTSNWLSVLDQRLIRLNPLSLETLTADAACLVLVDLINGFTREGPLASPRVEALIPVAALLTRQALQAGIPVLALTDAHSENAAEFGNYPPHCLSGTSESRLVRELEEIQGIVLLEKNSTMIWHEPVFQAWLSSHTGINTWILAGDCTDICILQLALALKTHYQRQDLYSRVIVPVNVVNTFDTDSHPGDLYHRMGLTLMKEAGIELVSQVV
jgi:nicotinamidase-related amidase